MFRSKTLLGFFLLIRIYAHAHDDEEPNRLGNFVEWIDSTQRGFLDPEAEKIRNQYWKDTLEDIRLMAGYKPRSNSSSSSSLLGQWKLLAQDYHVFSENSLNHTTAVDAHDVSTIGPSRHVPRVTSLPPRFEGFPSWERMLQDWSDDIQEYLDQASEDSVAGYMFGNYGRAPTKLPVNANEAEIANVTVVASKKIEMKPIVRPVTSKNLQMPIPAPAKPGEEVLPHTDISDKSKRILVVTTAAMPWKTGTAVNPLLRAAYLTQDRKDVGGSVTLMLPWLERKDDQVRVYGANGIFATPDDQESYIRTWLRESANMPRASEELNIQWYTAWQNKVENSIYSMGDITAVVSADDVDICILEEPEHLNWYRAPGESWTKKFKHVVGILHTNYFSYALDQPAALIRVSRDAEGSTIVQPLD